MDYSLYPMIEKNERFYLCSSWESICFTAEQTRCRHTMKATNLLNVDIKKNNLKKLFIQTRFTSRKISIYNTENNQ